MALVEQNFKPPMADIQLDQTPVPVYAPTSPYDHPVMKAREGLYAGLDKTNTVSLDVDHTLIDKGVKDLYNEDKVLDFDLLEQKDPIALQNMRSMAEGTAKYGIVYNYITGKGLNADRYFDALNKVKWSTFVDEGMADIVVPVKTTGSAAYQVIPPEQHEHYRNKHGLYDMRYIQMKPQYISTVEGDEGRILAKNGRPIIILHSKGNGSITEDAAAPTSEFMMVETFDTDFYSWLAEYGPLLRASSMDQRMKQLAGPTSEEWQQLGSLGDADRESAQALLKRVDPGDTKKYQAKLKAIDPNDTGALRTLLASIDPIEFKGVQPQLARPDEDGSWRDEVTAETLKAGPDDETRIKAAKLAVGDMVLFDPSDGKANMAVDLKKIFNDTPEAEALRARWRELGNVDYDIQGPYQAKDKDAEKRYLQWISKAMDHITQGRNFDWMPSVANGYLYFDFAPKGANKGSRVLRLKPYIENIWHMYGINEKVHGPGGGDNLMGNDKDFDGAVDYLITNDSDRAPSVEEKPHVVHLPGDNRMDRIHRYLTTLVNAHEKKQKKFQ